ncbi:MAG: hypothetical protein AAFP90_02125 [Planctomycetota bacterium]
MATQHVSAQNSRKQTPPESESPPGSGSIDDLLDGLDLGLQPKQPASPATPSSSSPTVLSENERLVAQQLTRQMRMSGLRASRGQWQLAARHQENVLAMLDALLQPPPSQQQSSPSTPTQDSAQESSPQRRPSDSESSDPSQQQKSGENGQQPEQSDDQQQGPMQAAGSQESESQTAPSALVKESDADASMLDRLRRSAWGHLPMETRQQLMSTLPERYMPGYEASIRRYFEAINATRRASPQR